ncbi:hypothetical protein FRC11_010796, partial [Ceratobasidium sp. 423]
TESIIDAMGEDVLQSDLSFFMDFVFEFTVWQGLMNFNWTEMANAMAEGAAPPFDMFQMPPNLPWHIPLSQWDDKDVNSLYDWILQHQRCLYTGDKEAEKTAPQFLEEQQGEPFQQEGEAIIYDASMAFYYMAMQQYHFTDDAYHPLSITTTSCFSPQFIETWSHILSPPLVKLLELIDHHELCNPLGQEPKDTDPPILHNMLNTSTELTSFLINYQVPSATYKWGDEQHNQYKILALWNFITLKEEMHGGHITPDWDTISWGGTEDEQISRIIDTLMTQISSSMDNQSQPDIYKGRFTNRWAPSEIIFKHPHSSYPWTFPWPIEVFGSGKSIKSIDLDVTASQAIREPKLADVTEAGTLAIIPLPEPFDASARQSGAGPAKDVEVSVRGVADSLMQYEDQVININDSDLDSVDPWDKYGASIKCEAIPLPSPGAIQQTTEVLMTSLAQQSGSERLLTSALPLVQAGTTS